MNKKAIVTIFGIGILALLLLIGCTPQTLPPSAEDIQTALAQTLTAEPSPTLSPTPKTTDAPQASPTPYQTPTATVSPPISGTINAAYLNLRSGPSTLFEIIQTFVEDTAVTATARTADGEWVKVEIEFEDDPTLEGWMSTFYLELEGDPTGLPEEVFSPSQILTGKIEDTEGNPIYGVNVAFILQNEALNLRADALSNSLGEFTMVIPEDLIATFDVQIVSWTCESSIVNTNCQFSGYVEVEDRAFINSPQEEAILFLYEPVDLVLQGTVLDAGGDPVDRIQLIAERDDGAVSYAVTDALGDFSMPISPGIWEVFSVTYDPDYLEGERLQLEIADTVPEQVTVEAPSD